MLMYAKLSNCQYKPNIEMIYVKICMPNTFVLMMWIVIKVGSINVWNNNVSRRCQFQIFRLDRKWKNMKSIQFQNWWAWRWQRTINLAHQTCLMVVYDFETLILVLLPVERYLLLGFYLYPNRFLKTNRMTKFNFEYTHQVEKLSTCRKI